MSFEYIWGVLKIKGNPPSDEKLRIPSSKYKYYPFLHQGLIFTADPSLWDLSPTGVSTGGGSKVSHWPSSNELADFIAGLNEEETWLLLIFSDQPSARTIDPAATVPLTKIPPPLKDGFSSVGFDVIDMSGLSALTNVGYTEDDLSRFANMTIETNDCGLISTSGDSHRFAEFASSAAPEHAPFFPVEVWGKKR